MDISIYLTMNLSIYLNMNISNYLSNHYFIYLTKHLPIYLDICLRIAYQNHFLYSVYHLLYNMAQYHDLKQ